MQVTLTGVILAVLAPSAPAEEGGEAKKVDIQVWTIRATRSNNEISEELKPLAEALKKDFKFTGYERTKTDSKSVPIDEKLQIKLLGPYNMTITPQGRTQKHIELRIVVAIDKDKEKDPKLDTTIRLAPEKFQLLGGWGLSGGDVLIVAVSAK